MDFYILLSMLAAELFVDFNLQGILADFKQKEYWDVVIKNLKSKAKNKLPEYKYDYIVSLLIHGFIVSFAFTIPYVIAPGMSDFNKLSLVIIANTILHAGIDHLKANKKCINLLEDQLAHFICVIISWFILVY